MKNNTDNYKTYAVTIEIQSGDYEKHNRMLIHAPDWEKAWHFACYAESHDPDDLQWDTDRGCGEPDGSFYYRLEGVEEVPVDEVPVVRKHLSYMVYYAEVLAKCGDYLEEMI